MSNELANLKNHFQQVAAETQGGALGTLLKFKKGRYYIDDDEVTGETRLAHVEATMRGYVKFQDGKRVAQRIGRVADGYQLPQRKDLGDLDEAEWERDASGKLKDPWGLQYYLPMEDPEDVRDCDLRHRLGGWHRRRRQALRRVQQQCREGPAHRQARRPQLSASRLGPHRDTRFPGCVVGWRRRDAAGFRQSATG